MVASETPYIDAASFVGTSLDEARISRTWDFVSFDFPWRSPRLCVPCAILSCWFSVGVAHLKWFGEQHPPGPLPQECAA